MDDEHKACTDSFNRLLQYPSNDNLQELYDILAAHFRHEEDLMKQYTMSSVSSSFSSVTSHAKDHARILKLIQDEMERVGCSGSDG